MIKGVLICISVCFIVSCKAEKLKKESSLEINRFAKDSFLLATKLVDTTEGGEVILIDGMTAIIVPEKMGGEGDDFKGANKVGFEMPCQCALKEDTLSVISSLAWEGGFAYIARASKGQTSNSLLIFGKDRRWELSGQKFKEEIEVASLTNKLVISSSFPFKENEIIYGWFDIRTPVFFEIKETSKEKESDQHILRVYFSCQVRPEIF
jgi:hypothetical protein